MKIEYRNKKIKDVCTSMEKAREKYGLNMALEIHDRVQLIASAENVEEMILNHIARCHPLHGNRKGQYAVDLIQPYRLVFKTHEGIIQIAEILEVVDYHK